jgi:hypothetical protein
MNTTTQEYLPASADAPAVPGQGSPMPPPMPQPTADRPFPIPPQLTALREDTALSRSILAVNEVFADPECRGLAAEVFARINAWSFRSEIGGDFKGGFKNSVRFFSYWCECDDRTFAKVTRKLFRRRHLWAQEVPSGRGKPTYKYIVWKVTPPMELEEHVCPLKNPTKSKPRPSQNQRALAGAYKPGERRTISPASAGLSTHKVKPGERRAYRPASAGNESPASVGLSARRASDGKPGERRLSNKKDQDQDQKDQGGKEKPPEFEPVPRGLKPLDYKDLLADAKDGLLDARKKYRERTLHKAVAERIAYIRKSPRAEGEKDIHRMESDETNWVAGDLTPLGKQHVAAWEARIAEIERAKKGIK